jgi:predicted DNA-binding protein with PD1-like motif
MMFEISEKSRRAVGSMARGTELISALTLLCEDKDIRAGEFRAVGTFSEVELSRFNPSSRAIEHTYSGSGSMEIVSAHGQIGQMGNELAIRLQVSLLVDSPLGPQLACGLVQRAIIEDLEFVCDIFMDLEIQRRINPETCRLAIDSVDRIEALEADRQPNEAWTPPKPETPTVPTTPEVLAPPRPNAPPQPSAATRDESQNGISWDDAVTENAPSSADGTPKWTDSEMEEEPELQAGDVLDHPKLGVCRVMKVEHGDYAHIRLGRGKIRKLSLEVCALIPAGETEDGHTRYKVRVRR